MIKKFLKFKLIFSLILTFLGYFLLNFKNLFSNEIKIHDTSLMPQINYKFIRKNIKDKSNFILNINNFFIYKSFSYSDYSIIIEGPIELNFTLNEIFGSTLHHDIVYCHQNCNLTNIIDIIPPILIYLKISNNKKNLKLIFNTGIYLDLIKLIINYFGPFSIFKQINKFNFPLIKIYNNNFKQFESFLLSLNNMDHQFIYGPMFFEIINNNQYISHPILFLISLFFLIPQIIYLFENFDYILIILILLTFIHPIFNIFNFIYIFIYNVNPSNSIIYLIFKIIFYLFINPSKIFNLLNSLIYLIFLPPYCFPLLYFKFDLLPIIISFLSYYLKKKINFNIINSFIKYFEN